MNGLTVKVGGTFEREFTDKETGVLRKMVQQECVCEIPGKLAGIGFFVMLRNGQPPYDPNKLYTISPQSYSPLDRNAGFQVRYPDLVELKK